jgi:DNA polymerase III, alpha subunit|nr:MAG TPA: DNA polymerase III, alpha subunit [Caudoviricetes sp.]
MNFTDLHSHSFYSRRDAYSSLEERVKRAKEIGYTAVSLTDHGTTSGLTSHYITCNEMGIKPILGMEAYFSYDLSIKTRDSYHLILLAKDKEGLYNLRRLSTFGAYNHYYKPLIDYNALRKYSEGIIVSTACVAGPLRNELLRDEFITTMTDIFKDDFYLEVQPHDFPLQWEYNKVVEELGKQYNIPIIVTGDSHYAYPEQMQAHRDFLLLDRTLADKKAQIDDAYTEKAKEKYQDEYNHMLEYYDSRDYHMWTIDEFKAVIPNQEYYDNVSKIIDKCNVEIPFGENHYPVFPVKDPSKYVRDHCADGYKLHRIAKKENKDVCVNQIKHELDILTQVDYNNYFCIIHDMLQWARKNGMRTGVGRGSVCGSLVAYLMGITEVDPIQYNLVFERFTNPERVTPCDIDCDFQQSRRQEVIKYIQDKYGYAYPVRTFGFLRPKAAVQHAGKVLGRKASDMTAISKNINDIADIKDKEVRDMASTSVNRLVNYGTHASAVAVFPNDPAQWCAIEYQDGQYVAAEDFHILEKQGILKLDILGLATLDIIDDVLKRVKDCDIHSIPLQDDKTAQLLQAGNTTGIFQIESDVMTNIVTNIHSKSVYDLVDTVAIGRPGVLDVGMDKVFIARRQGKEPVTYLHPLLEPILKDTEGVILYQEQIMQIVQALAGYTMGEADILRRIISRKELDKINTAVDEFVKRAGEKGISEDVIRPIAEQMIACGSYVFNRGHSAAYGLTAWRCAYLKAHYPEAYYASILDMNFGDKEKLSVFINDAKKHGINIIPPDIYGDITCTTGKNVVCLGLGAIAGCSNLKSFTPERGKTFLEINQSMNMTQLKGLIYSGAIDDGGDRNDYMQYIKWLKDKRKSKGEYVFDSNHKDNLSKGAMELAVLGYTFHSIFDEYDTSICVGNVKPAIILSVTARKTKKGKPYAFLTVQTPTGVEKLVTFEVDFAMFTKGNVYALRIRDGVVVDACSVNRLTA